MTMLISRSRTSRTPRFGGMRPSSKGSYIIKRHNRSAGTAHEKLLQRELRRLGLRFQINVSTLPGEPDIVFADTHVAVFCDGDFWHGRLWKRLKRKLLKG